MKISTNGVFTKLVLLLCTQCHVLFAEDAKVTKENVGTAKCFRISYGIFVEPDLAFVTLFTSVRISPSKENG